MAARIAMIAITTSSSIRVNPALMALEVKHCGEERRSPFMRLSFRGTRVLSTHWQRNPVLIPSPRTRATPTCLFPSAVSTRPVRGVVDPDRTGYRAATVFFPLQLRDARGIAAQVDVH